MEHKTQIISLRDFLIILFKYKFIIPVIFMAIVITVTVRSLLLQPVYEAKSTLMVKLGREYIYSTDVAGARPMISLEEAIKSEMQILTSKDLIEKVINTLGVKKIYADIIKIPPKRMTPLEAAILRFERNISVKDIKKSNVIEVSFQHSDSEIAAKAVNELVELYKEKHLQVLSNPKSSFLEKQLNTYQQKLKESENNLEAFKQKHKIISLDEQKSLLLKQRVDMDTSLKTILNRIHELKQMLSSPKDLLPMTFEKSPYYTKNTHYEIINNARSELLSMQLKEQELLGKYKESSRLVVNIRKEIHLIKELIKEQEDGFVKSELSSLEAKGANIIHQLDQLDKEITALDLTEKELQNLKRNVAAHEKNYKIYLSKLEEARITEDMDRQKIANIAVIQKAFVPSKPIKPRKRVNIAVGIVIGAIFSLGFALFSEYMSQGLSSPASAEIRLDLPVLCSIPYSRQKRKTKSPFFLWAGRTSAALFLIAVVFWIFPNKTLHLIKENRGPSHIVRVKPVTLEVQEDLPLLNMKPLVSESEPSALTVHKAPQQEMVELSVPPVLKASLLEDIKDSQWAIHIASTTLKRNAIDLLTEIKKEGYNTYITEFHHKNKLWYRVRIGFFPTREHARRIAESLPEKYSLHDYWIVKASGYEIGKHQRK